jgi:hypothetical protein
MKIDRMTVRNFLAIEELDVQITTPTVLIASKNEQGKTSTADAIALALLGRMPRGVLKKDAGALLHLKADAGVVEIQGPACGAKVKLPSMERMAHGLNALPVEEFVVACLLPSTFASLPVQDRRAFLFKLLGSTTMSAEAVTARLLDRGCKRKQIDALVPMVKFTGFEEAAQEAANRARDLKSEWRAITGEAWGSSKAGKWKAPEPSGASDADIIAARQEAEKLTAKVAKLNQSIGALDAAAAAAERRQKQIEKVRQEASQYAARADRLNALRRSLAMPENLKTCACPECGSVVGMDVEAGKLLKMSSPQLKSAELELHRAEQAVAELKGLEGITDPPFDPAELEKLSEQLAQAKDLLRTATSQHDAALSARRMRDQAAQRTAKAAEINQEIDAWLHIGEALSPGGIPAELLAATIQPFNDRLAANSLFAGWKTVRIREDMEITCDGRPYQLMSASAKFRADVLIAEAIACFSGFRTICLDGIDILDSQGRIELVTLMDGLAEVDAIDTAIVLGTFKTAPSGLPESIAVHWLEQGKLLAVNEEPQAA